MRCWAAGLNDLGWPAVKAGSRARRCTDTLDGAAQSPLDIKISADGVAKSSIVVIEAVEAVRPQCGLSTS